MRLRLLRFARQQQGLAEVEVHPGRRVLVVQPVRHLLQGLRQVLDGLVDLLLVEQRHAQIVMRPGVVRIEVEGL